MKNWYTGHTEKELLGRRVRTLREMSNGYATVARGAVGVITRKFGGLAVNFLPCEHCGTRMRMSKIDYRFLELIPS